MFLNYFYIFSTCLLFTYMYLMNRPSHGLFLGLPTQSPTHTKLIGPLHIGPNFHLVLLNLFGSAPSASSPLHLGYTNSR